MIDNIPESIHLNFLPHCKKCSQLVLDYDDYSIEGSNIGTDNVRVPYYTVKCVHINACKNFIKETTEESGL